VSSLDDLRREIDDIDRQIVELLARRMRACRDIAEVKAESGSAVIQPGRVRDVLTSRRRWAIEAGIDADFAEQLFRAILAETHRIEVADHHHSPPPVKDAGSPLRTPLDTVACRIDHVVVTVADLAAASSFFEELGFRIEPTDDRQIVSAVAGGVTVILVGPGDDPAVAEHLAAHGSGVQHIAIEVLNAGFARDALDVAGVPRLTDVIVDNEGHEQVFTVVDPATGVQLGFISRTGHRVAMTSENVRAMFGALS